MARISSVWGNEPIVVAGKVGRPSLCCCSLLALGERRVAARVGLGQGLDPGSDVGGAGAMRVAAGVERPVVGVELIGDRLAPVGEALGEGRQLTDLLDGEGHPGAHLVIEIGVAVGGLGVEVDRDV